MDQKLNDFRLDFLGIGTLKSGTSLVSDLLMQHPQIQWASRKEVNYFNKYQADGSRNPYQQQPFSFYTRFFNADPKDDKKRGEFSPVYLYDQHAIDTITSSFPHIKLFITLRHPVDRAFSHYLYERDFLQTIEPDLSFEEAIERYSYFLKIGFYGKQISYLLDRIPASQCKILIFEEMIQQPERDIQGLYNHIGVDSDFTPQVKPVNAYKKVKNQGVRSFFDKAGEMKSFLTSSSSLGKEWMDVLYNSKYYPVLLQWKHSILDANTESGSKPAIDPNTYLHLSERYKEDMALLQSLLQRDEPVWPNQIPT